MMRNSSESCWSRLATVILISASLFLNSTFAELNNQTSPTHVFRSRPDLHAPIISIHILRPELVAPGYIFLAPYRNKDPGPYIYDNFGNLVWSGAGMSGPKTAHAPHTCPYKGETHLCFFQGQQSQGFARGFGTIMDRNYRVIKTLESKGAGASSDMHEYRMAPFSNGTTALMTIYQPRTFDLMMNPKYKIIGGMGWIVEGMFQEVDIETGEIIFEWRSTDHVDPSLSHVYPSATDTSGDGLTETTPWDYFHINSIDKNAEGDYMISARHMSAVYKLSGVDGRILWQLGGKNPTFNQTNFVFSSQHHARFVSENTTHTILSMFDNGSNTYMITAQWSHGFIIAINHIDNTAAMIQSFGAPDANGGLLSGSQGNMQIMPNGNVHIGWGEHAYFSEHTPDGSAVMYASLADRASNVMIYRSYKFNWTGTPVTKPSLWTYARNHNSAAGMVFYASWNGATEVKSWNFYVGKKSTGPFKKIANVPKSGFETFVRHKAVEDWAFAEALDANGRALERSMISKTFVPSDSLRPYCTDWACAAARKDLSWDNNEHNEEEVQYMKQFKLPEQLLSPNRGFDTRKYYADSPTNMFLRNMTKNVDVGSLILGVGLSVMLAIVVGIALYLVRRPMASSVREMLDHMSREKVGKYSKVDGEEELDHA